MDNNPYQAPNPAVTYYTDDIVLMPSNVIWRVVRRQAILIALLLFPYFLARKFLRLRHTAKWASYRLTQIDPIDESQIPPQVRTAFAPFVDAYEQFDMRPIYYFRPPWIGAKSGFWSIWLDPTGLAYCNLFWIDIRIGSFQSTKVGFACHSRLINGTELHTASLAPADWFPEVCPSNHDVMRLPENECPAAVIERHRQRIANRADLIQFDEQTLHEELIRGGREQFDYMIAKGFYVPITDKEAERLLSSHPSSMNA